MATPFRYELKGISEAINRLRAAAVNIEREIDAEIQAAMVKMEQTAVAKVPVDEGRLKGAVGWEKTGRLDYNLGAKMKYAAFVEFGSRLKVDVPSELRSWAAQFNLEKGQQGPGQMKAIFAWCKRKGIPPNRAYWIYRSLMNKGQAPHPFMWPAYLAGRGPLVERVKNVMKKPR
jgi:HK97 gp10 family phage protein